MEPPQDFILLDRKMERKGLRASWKRYTTTGYIINRGAMDYLVDNINGYSKEIDVFYAEEIQPRFNCYCTIPHIIHQREGYSDIQNKNVKYKLLE